MNRIFGLSTDASIVYWLIADIITARGTDEPSWQQAIFRADGVVGRLPSRSLVAFEAALEELRHVSVVWTSIDGTLEGHGSPVAGWRRSGDRYEVDLCRQFWTNYSTNIYRRDEGGGPGGDLA